MMILHSYQEHGSHLFFDSLLTHSLIKLVYRGFVAFRILGDMLECSLGERTVQHRTPSSQRTIKKPVATSVQEIVVRLGVKMQPFVIGNRTSRD